MGNSIQVKQPKAMRDAKSPDPVIRGVSSELKKVIYQATHSEKEFNFFVDAFGKMAQSEIQRILDHWFNTGSISISKRDILKAFKVIA